VKKAVLFLSAFLASGSSFAQGTLIFKTLGVQNAAGTGTYNVPLFQCSGPFGGGNSTAPAGLLPGGVTVGLFTPGSTAPFATGVLGTTPATGPYIVTPPSQTVAIPGAAPGTTPTIFIRAWQGSSFAEALQSGGQFREWQYTTKPLGGDPGGGALPITPPTLTGWGAETGTGYELNCIPEPSSVALSVLGFGGLAFGRTRFRKRI